MGLKKQHVLLLLVVCVLVSTLAAYRVFAQKTVNTNALTFTATEGGYVFFDHSSGTIYAYNSRNGEVLSVWKLQRLGAQLTRLE